MPSTNNIIHHSCTSLNKSNIMAELLANTLAALAQKSMEWSLSTLTSTSIGKKKVKKKQSKNKTTETKKYYKVKRNMEKI